MLSKKRGNKADWKNGKEIIALFVLNDLFLPNARGWMWQIAHPTNKVLRRLKPNLGNILYVNTTHIGQLQPPLTFSSQV